ncbi:hypothetical protein QQ020_34010 [Fulvivirgaceae bacterium BMA12]|uniref:Lipocalin-like domain-containing protein n=1 Tax=Agaribacillus aureus TaxID=3051825 RepID=A0ABT8LH59_9BACT|nr:hypothetical protein [Fulvivirgaceae bacterium BMA12]
MKNIKILSANIIILSLSLVFLGSCGGDDDADPKADQTAKLAKTWSASTVRLDNVDVTIPSYENFSITFSSAGTYSTQDGDPIFTGNGSWSFDGDNVNAIIISGTKANITLNGDATTLVLTFTAPDAPLTGRAYGLSGNYEFNLTAP